LIALNLTFEKKYSNHKKKLSKNFYEMKILNINVPKIYIL